MLRISLSKQAQKFIAKLPPKQKRQVAEKVSSLRDDPFPNDYKSLQGYAPYSRVDCGEYRIIYRLDDEGQLILVAVIGKRNDSQAYKLLKRKV